MSGVEAAASLFGSDEASSDPFAAIATPADQDNSHSAAGDLFSSNGSVEPDFFASTANGPQTYEQPQQNGSVGHYDGQESLSHQQYGHQASYSVGSNTSSMTQNQTQSWYSGQDQRTGQQQYYNTSQAPYTVHQQNVYSQQHNHTTYQNSDPYASPSTAYQQSTTSANTATAQGYSASSAYDPYALAQVSNPTTTNPYVPPSQTATASVPYTSYNSYSTPSASQTYSHYSQTSTVAPHNPYGTTHATPAIVPPPATSTATASVPAPPPPAPNTALNRPKVTNAYDPPFPTSKPKPPRASAMQPSYSAYGAYQPATTPPPAPPVTHSYSTGAYVHAPQTAATPPPPPRSSHARPPMRSSAPSVPGYSSPPGPTPHGLTPSSSGYNQTIDGLPHSEFGNNTMYAAAHQPSQPDASASYSLNMARATLSPPRAPPQPISAPSVPAPPVLAAPATDGGPPGEDPEGMYDPEGFGMDPEGLDRPARNDTQVAESALSWSSSPLPSTDSSQSIASHHTTSPQQTHATPSSPELHHVAKRAVSPTSYLGPSRRNSPEIQRRGSPLVSHGSLMKGARTTTYIPQPFSAVDRVSSPTPSHTSAHDGQEPPVHRSDTLSSYLPTSTAPTERAHSPGYGAIPENGHARANYYPYAPKLNGPSGEGASSPDLFSNQTPRPSYINPPTDEPVSSMDPLRQRSISNGSLLSNASTLSSTADPYAPRNRRQTDSATAYYPTSYDAQPQNGDHVPYGASPYDSGMPQQEVSLKPIQTTYAPSPSLLGANDLLGRTSKQVPVISFGFGGKFVTCFHGAASLNTGFDVALSSKNSTGVHIKHLKAILSPSVLDTSTSVYPGPLFSDPGTPVSSIVRPGASTQTKNKKAKVIKYLEERTEEFTRAIGYLHAKSPEKHQAEGRLVIVKLLKIMVENDGRLTGSAAIDVAIRSALVPSLEGTISAADGDLTSSATFSTMGDSTKSLELDAILNAPLPTFAGESSGPTISVSTLRASSLDKIQNFLLRGERRQAYHYALDEKLWGHAMVIASSLDKEAWKEVVSEFLRSELGVKDGITRSTGLLRPSEPAAPLTNGREALKVAYSLYSGHGAAAVQELVPQNLLVRATTGQLAIPSNPQLTPRTPNFSAPTPSSSIPQESLERWDETAAMMISNPITTETSSALTALGDQLLAHQWVDAAHACFLLSRQTSPVGGLGNQAARIILLGSRSPQVWPKFAKDQDAIIFTEIFEFAQSLGTPKGADPFNGFAHFQAYKFLRAMYLAEIGDLQVANRYCEAITASLSRQSPYFTPVLLDNLKALAERITGNHSDKPGSWMSTKIAKPTFNGIGGWLEGRLTELVTGGTDTRTEEDNSKADERTFSGPFASISQASSASPSPAPSFINPNVLPPYRSGSAMANVSPYTPPPDRSLSAIDYTKHKPPPAQAAPRIASANAATTTFAQTQSFAQDSSPYTNYWDATASRTSLTIPQETSSSSEGNGWWSSTSSQGQTPTATTFHKIDEGSVAADSEGFISLMDSTPFPIAQPTSSGNGNDHGHGSHMADDDFDDDLGLANPKKKEKKSAEETAASGPTPAGPAKAAEPQQPAQQASTGGWFSRWWKRDGNAPIKASLGEESSFYYDEKLKKWVDKKTGAAEAKSTPLPPPPPRTPSLPPSRAQTASPGTAMRPPMGGPSFTPPPRASSTVDLRASPPTMRVRSNLVPGTADSAPSTPTGTRSGPPPPPMSRPASQASKRNVRNRYVDVFQQDGAAP